MTHRITIGSHHVGLNDPTYFIADIAASHDGDLEKAKALIYSAAEAGADAAKFQNFQAKTIVSDHGFKALGNQLSHQAKWQKSVYEVYQDAELPVEWTETLKEVCDDAGIDYFTSPYSKELTDAVEPYVSAWKMGSGDITWPDQIRYMCQTGKPFILATGASTIEEVQQAMDAALAVSSDVILMQCNTNYTARLDESDEERYGRFASINLKVLETYAKLYPDVVLGLSDHTHGHSTVLAAVGLFNARAVEKHYTLDNNAIGPDHPFSMNPKTWAEMVAATRELESVLTPSLSYNERYALVEERVEDKKELELSIGDGIKRVEDNEKDTVVLQRRSIRANRELSKGDVLSEDDLFPLRPAPEGSYTPAQKDLLIGAVLNRDLAYGECVFPEDLESESLNQKVAT